MESSKKINLNLFTNFLLNSFPEDSDTIIETCDCENFVVVKGQTSHKEVINLSEVRTKFEQKYPDIGTKNTIDLISYENSFDEEKKFQFTFYNTFDLKSKENHTSNLFTLSDFPYGHSWDQGKLLYYYFKFITYKIPTNYPYTWINYQITVDKNNQVDFFIEDNYLNNHNNILKSAILDTFDFDLYTFGLKAKKMDLEKLILNPYEKEDILNIEIKDFIIV